MLGIIPGVDGVLSHQLELFEIYEIGFHAQKLEDYDHAVEWIRTALNTIDENVTKNGIKKDQIWDSLAYSEFKVNISNIFSCKFRGGSRVLQTHV